MTSRPPTPRQWECFEAFARLGDHEAAVAELNAKSTPISLGRHKRNVLEYYRRIGANSGIQAAYLTWGPKAA